MNLLISAHLEVCVFFLLLLELEFIKVDVTQGMYYVLDDPIKTDQPH